MGDREITDEIKSQQRKALLKNLQLCLKALLSSSDQNQDVVFENSIHLDRFCLALENVLRFGFKGDQKQQKNIINN